MMTPLYSLRDSLRDSLRGQPAHRRRTWRATVLTVAALATLLTLLLTSGVVMAQSSFGYDLACRSHYTAAGGRAVSATYGLNAAAGLPAVGTTQATTYGLRSGYLAGYPVAASVAASVAAPVAATANASATTVAPQANAAIADLWLPILRSSVRIIRGGC